MYENWQVFGSTNRPSSNSIHGLYTCIRQRVEISTYTLWHTHTHTHTHAHIQGPSSNSTQGLYTCMGQRVKISTYTLWRTRIHSHAHIHAHDLEPSLVTLSLSSLWWDIYNSNSHVQQTRGQSSTRVSINRKEIVLISCTHHVYRSDGWQLLCAVAAITTTVLGCTRHACTHNFQHNISSNYIRFQIVMIQLWTNTKTSHAVKYFDLMSRSCLWPRARYWQLQY